MGRLRDAILNPNFGIGFYNAHVIEHEAKFKTRRTLLDLTFYHQIYSVPKIDPGRHLSCLVNANLLHDHHVKTWYRWSTQ